VRGTDPEDLACILTFEKDLRVNWKSHLKRSCAAYLNACAAIPALIGVYDHGRLPRHGVGKNSLDPAHIGAVIASDAQLRIY